MSDVDAGRAAWACVERAQEQRQREERAFIELVLAALRVPIALRPPITEEVWQIVRRWARQRLLGVFHLRQRPEGKPAAS